MLQFGQVLFAERRPPVLGDSWKFIGVTILARCLGVVYILAGISKLASPGDFLQTIRRLKFIPQWSEKFIARILPRVEVSLGVLLLIGALERYVAVFSIFLLLVFGFVALVAVMRGVEVPCSCFGQFSSETLSVRTIARNGMLAVLTLPLILRQTPSSLSMDAALAGDVANWGHVVFLTFVAMLAIGLALLVSQARLTLRVR